MPANKNGFKILFIFPCLLSLFIIFIGAVSINTGLNNTSRDGFIIPIICGIILIFASLILIYNSARFFFSKSREKELINRF